jgi:hypothetical protein
MLENYFSRPSTLNRLRSGPIGSDVDDLATALQQQGYAWDSIRNGYRFKPGHPAPSITCRDGLTALPGHGQLVDL